ncbi:MAG: hypothetical protein JW874_07770 [Spirochaetales bacterium]|nr:hypothetical protein [Spirochaetales bacterium]
MTATYDNTKDPVYRDSCVECFISPAVLGMLCWSDFRISGPVQQLKPLCIIIYLIAYSYLREKCYHLFQ